MSRDSTCRSCGAVVIWCEFPDGVCRPVEKVADANAGRYHVALTAALIPGVRQLAHTTKSPSHYVLHIARCGDAESWREYEKERAIAAAEGRPAPASPAKRKAGA